MSELMPRRVPVAALFVLVILAQTSWAQRASNWRVYKMADGLAEPGCASVTLSSKNKVIVKHPVRPYVSECDGYHVRTISLPERASRVWESPAGQFWIVNSQGLAESKGGPWTSHPLPEIGALYITNAPRLLDVSLCPVRQGQVLVLLPNCLIDFNTEETPQARVVRYAAQTRIGHFTGLVLARDGGLWITGEGGFAKIPLSARNLRRTPDAAWRELLAPAELSITNLQDLREYEDASLTMVADSRQGGRRFLVQYEGEHWSAKLLGDEKIRTAWRGPDRTVWAITATSLLSYEESGEAVENEEVSARFYNDVAVESTGSFWLATSDGLFRYAPIAWRSPRVLPSLTSPVQGLIVDRDDNLWFISAGSLHSLQNERHREYPLRVPELPRLTAASRLFALKEGQLLLESAGALFNFDPANASFSQVPIPPSGLVPKILGYAGNGIVCIQYCSEGTNAAACRLELYDGARAEPIPEPPPELTAGELNIVFASQNGALWLGGQAGAAIYYEQHWTSFVASDGSAPPEALSFAETADGKIWCATQDAIWEYDGHSWTEIRRGFDRINGMVRSRGGNIWVATNSGLFRYFQAASSWIDNGLEEGLPATSIRRVLEDQRSRIWVATAHGLSLYHPEADVDPPQTEILEEPETGNSMPENAALNVSFTGRDKWKQTFRDRLLFSHRLDQREWSEFTDVTRVSLSDLPPGKHYFQVRAMDRNCNYDLKPAQLEFSVVLPWFKETRLVLIATAGVAIGLFFAGLALNRHWRLVRSYAEVERKVAERTLELERANRELLHSQKMTALGTLAAGIAHDFNNILSIIKGSAQIIEENLDQPEKVRTRVDRIKTVVEQGAGIARAMLGFSRDSGQQTGPCDLNLVVQDTIKLLGDRFLREVQVTFDPTPGLPEVPCSRDLIQQIILNFIFNAAESMTSSREVVISTSLLQRLPPGLVLVPVPAKEYVCVSVEDFGCGIAPEVMPRIFEPFFTTKAFSARRGTGLGLSMVYELARKIQAGITVVSAVNEGSKFSLILPVPDAPVSAAPASAKAQKTAPLPNL